MNTEQERAEFEAWWKNRQVAVSIKEDAFAAYQAGRAALQSQDREDALRYRWLRDKSRVFKQDPDMSGNHYWMVGINGALRGATIDAAIDHARRVEGGIHANS